MTFPESQSWWQMDVGHEYNCFPGDRNLRTPKSSRWCPGPWSPGLCSLQPLNPPAPQLLRGQRGVLANRRTHAWPSCLLCVDPWPQSHQIFWKEFPWKIRPSSCLSLNAHSSNLMAWSLHSPRQHPNTQWSCPYQPTEILPGSPSFLSEDLWI